jgi:hypothetical protein
VNARDFVPFIAGFPRHKRGGCCEACSSADRGKPRRLQVIRVARTHLQLPPPKQCKEYACYLVGIPIQHLASRSSISVVAYLRALVVPYKMSKQEWLVKASDRMQVNCIESGYKLRLSVSSSFKWFYPFLVGEFCLYNPPIGARYPRFNPLRSRIGRSIVNTFDRSFKAARIQRKLDAITAKRVSYFPKLGLSRLSVTRVQYIYKPITK